MLDREDTGAGIDRNPLRRAAWIEGVDAAALALSGHVQ
jgi:hypothetical protein